MKRQILTAQLHRGRLGPDPTWAPAKRREQGDSSTQVSQNSFQTLPSFQTQATPRGEPATGSRVPGTPQVGRGPGGRGRGQQLCSESPPPYLSHHTSRGRQLWPLGIDYYKVLCSSHPSGGWGVSRAMPAGYAGHGDHVVPRVGACHCTTGTRPWQR